VSDALVESLTWGQVREQVFKVNPTLAGIIDNLSPAEKLTLIKAKYPYGESIFDKGVFKIANDRNEIVELADKSIKKELQSQLGYSILPVALVINNSAEVFIESPSRIVPLAYFNAGSIFGLWETFDVKNELKPIWQICAGARSLFMLPKISDSSSHGKLRREYNIKQLAPKTLADQWAIFTQIAKATHDVKPWHTEVIFFTADWNEKFLNDNEWLKLYLHLLRQAWSQTLHWRNKMHFELMWESFAIQAFSQNIKVKPYIINTVKHLIYIASGAYPGFIPACDETAGPIDCIIKAYLDVYGMSNYCPALMHPAYIRDENVRVYYSLQMPTLIENYTNYAKPASILSELRQIKELMDFIKNDFGVKHNLFENLLTQVDFEYHHNDDDPFHEISKTSKLFEVDGRFTCLNNRSLAMAEAAHFLRGCISIEIDKN
jgi:hypothetical protein